MSNLLVWNVRVIGMSQKNLRGLIQKYDVYLIAIFEPWLKEEVANRFTTFMHIPIFFFQMRL